MAGSESRLEVVAEGVRQALLAPRRVRATSPAELQEPGHRRRGGLRNGVGVVRVAKARLDRSADARAVQRVVGEHVPAGAGHLRRRAQDVGVEAIREDAPRAEGRLGVPSRLIHWTTGLPR